MQNQTSSLTSAARDAGQTIQCLACSGRMYRRSNHFDRGIPGYQQTFISQDSIECEKCGEYMSTGDAVAALWATEEEIAVCPAN